MERVAHVTAAGFLSRYLNGPLSYVRRHITVNIMCRVRRLIKLFLPSFPGSWNHTAYPNKVCVYQHASSLQERF